MQLMQNYLHSGFPGDHMHAALRQGRYGIRGNAGQSNLECSDVANLLPEGCSACPAHLLQLHSVGQHLPSRSGRYQQGWKKGQRLLGFCLSQGGRKCAAAPLLRGLDALNTYWGKKSLCVCPPLSLQYLDSLMSLDLTPQEAEKVKCVSCTQSTSFIQTPFFPSLPA